MKDLLNELLGPSIFLLVLDMFLEYPHQWMNLREIARRVNKNPGSISPVMPTLLEKGLVTDCKVGKVSVVYRLNMSNERVLALNTFRNKLKKSRKDNKAKWGFKRGFSLTANAFIVDLLSTGSYMYACIST